MREGSASRWVLRKGAFSSTSRAAKNGLLYTQCGKRWIWAVANSVKARAAAVIAGVTGVSSGLERGNLLLKLFKVYSILFYFRLQRLFLGLKIGVLSFKCRLLGLDECKVLAEDCRRAMLVDEFFEKIKKRHKCSV
jgi:hypothetical protein